MTQRPPSPAAPTASGQTVTSRRTRRHVLAPVPTSSGPGPWAAPCTGSSGCSRGSSTRAGSAPLPRRPPDPVGGRVLLAPVHRSNLDFLVVAASRGAACATSARRPSGSPRWFPADREPPRRHQGRARHAGPRLDAPLPRGGLEAATARAVPEGTRRTGPTVADLFEGTVYLALKAGVPIVPSASAAPRRRCPTARRSRSGCRSTSSSVRPSRSHPVRRRRHGGSSGRRRLRLQAEIQRLFDDATQRSEARG